MTHSLELLDRDYLLRIIEQQSRKLLQDIEVHSVLDSTNNYLLKDKDGPVKVCLAEQQTAGRGRRGRAWISPFGHNIYLSIRWNFPQGLSHVGGLSLAMGIAVIRALKDCGLTECGLKWPNDVLAQGRKLAGLLIDVVGETLGPCTAVIGVGLNMCLSPSQAKEITQPWVTIEELMGPRKISRNQLVARLIHRMVEILRIFTQQGFTPFQADWMALDQFQNKMVVLHRGEEKIRGIVKGVDQNGALLLESAKGQQETFFSGEISLRVVR